ncbi:MAG TPA: hypothetical protein VMN39_00360 [Longimicrobiaceae bacterium]|nr:hypothetical protein [Longimicrobiaceae bacterium]
MAASSFAGAADGAHEAASDASAASTIDPLRRPLATLRVHGGVTDFW